MLAAQLLVCTVPALPPYPPPPQLPSSSSAPLPAKASTKLLRDMSMACLLADPVATAGRRCRTADAYAHGVALIPAPRFTVVSACGAAGAARSATLTGFRARAADFDVCPFRTPASPLSGGCACAPAARAAALRVGVHARHARLCGVDRAAGGAGGCVRSAAVRRARSGGRLARQRPAAAHLGR